MFVDGVLKDYPKVIVKWGYSFADTINYGMVTKCLITTPENLPLSEGIAVCSDKDNFSRNKGRKISLQRALSKFDTETRQKFWEAYFKMRNGKW